jgi:nitrogen fixation NifU-like protein
MNLEELYHEELLDHARKPHNAGAIDGCSCTASGKNPLCGDTVTLFIERGAGSVKRVTFQGSGCVISQASASILTDALTGRTEVDCLRLIRDTVTALKAGAWDSVDDAVKPLSGVAAFPTRLKCALLAWKVAEDLLKGGKAEAGAA